MAETFRSKYASEEIDEYLGKAKTAVQPEDIPDKHGHTNLEVLSFFTEVDGQLYYKGRKVLLESAE